jgi:hypothetical protein
MGATSTEDNNAGEHFLSLAGCHDLNGLHGEKKLHWAKLNSVRIVFKNFHSSTIVNGIRPSMHLLDFST